MIHVHRGAFLRAPIADVRAQLADLLGEWAVAGDRIGAHPADSRALDAAGRTLALALLADHVGETGPTLGRAIVAGFDAVLGARFKMFCHGVT